MRLRRDCTNLIGSCGRLILATGAICVSLAAVQEHDTKMLDRITFVRQFHHKGTFVMVLEVGKKYFAWLPKESPYIPCEKDDTDDQIFHKIEAFQAAAPAAV
ncbi:hypothetical protein BH09VER1_BH09VER1_54500 [soil metagenome]